MHAIPSSLHSPHARRANGFAAVLLGGFCRMLYVLAVLALASSSASAKAESQADERARTHFMAGSSYFEEGRYHEAGDEFMESYRLSERFELLLNAAMAYERAGAFEPASAALEIYLGRLPEGSDEARSLRARIRHLEARAEEKRRIEAELEEARLVRQYQEQQASDKPSRSLSGLGWGGIGAGSLGALSLITSLATGLKASAVHGDLEERCGLGGASCPIGASDDSARGERLARASTGTLITGVTLGAGAALLILLDLKRSSKEDAHAWQLDQGPGELGLSLRRDF